MKSITILACTVFIATAALSQNWRDASDWRIYDITTTHTKRFHRDSLSYYHAIVLDHDSIQAYLTQIHSIPPDEAAGTAWMGDYWVTCKIDTAIKILRVSRYGGFFIDYDTGLYYELPEGQHRGWQVYLNNRYIAVRHE